MEGGYIINVRKNKVGMRFGRLTVISVDETKYVKKQGAYYICKCDCGNVVSVRGNTLGKNTRSCGCIKKEQDAKNLGRFTTGQSHSRLACIWYHMRSRCSNKNDTNYPRYGKLGVMVCKEWETDFLSFKKWAEENGYSDGLTLDRINPAGNYEPSNCRWISLSKQQCNKRGTLLVFHKGEYKSLKEAYNEEKPSISYQTARVRYNKGVADISELFRSDRQYRGKRAE